MCANVTPKASPSSTASTSRSLLSRLTGPLRSRTKYFSDFYIRPFEPHRHYAPGDIIKGLVVLTVVKPFRITHLSVTLHGFVRVYKNQAAVTDNTIHEPALTGSSKQARYFGNGHASLFQDEIILCGEGRLEAGVYEFEFHLDFPRKGLPTSIDFERGTISYMIRATITRPTSVAATSSCDRKISLVETIDIGSVVPPKPNIISLEPISKRAKRTVKPKPKVDQDAVDTENTPDVPRPADSPMPEESVSQRASVDHSRTPRSPVSSDVQSEASAESIASSKQSYMIGPVLPSSKPGRDYQDTHSSSSIAGKTITAKIELLKGGCLPGDNIPLKVSIQHTKRVKSMNGVIVTLYRQGRIDSAPPLSLFADIKGKAVEKLKHEEYYPKSKTGLGGLSLSSAGSSSVFRKDLSQTVTPIIIDPISLSTVVSASVRVPEDAFPTITGVPGQMISFRYHVEVVVDLGGKLAGDKQLERKIQPNFGFNGNLMFGRDDVSAGVLSALGGRVIDTDYIRREKSVVACLFEVIVGTKDSARLRGRQNPTPQNTCGEQLAIRAPQENTYSLDPGHGADEILDTGAEQSQDGPDFAYYSPRQFQEPPFHREGDQDCSFSLNPNRVFNRPSQQHRYTFVPPPEVPGEDLDEKERIRYIEETLLPSQPPQDDNLSTSLVIAPSAPDKLSGELCDIGHSVPGESMNIVQSAPSLSVSVLGGLIPHATPNPSEDKQELERHRLMAEASSPPDFPEDQEYAEGSSQPQYEPTAPVLAEDGEHGGYYEHVNGHNEFPPKYER